MFSVAGKANVSCMTLPARVLLIGQDEDHLERMAVVLRHFWVVEKALIDRVAEPVFDADLAVLCDSIEEPRRQRWVEGLRAEWPSLLIVKLNGYDSGPHASADATVDTAHGPGALVSTIYELLTERGIPSRPWAAHGDIPWLQ